MNNPYRSSAIVLYSPPIYTLVGRVKKWIKRLYLRVRGSYKKRFPCKCTKCGTRYQAVYFGSAAPMVYRRHPNNTVLTVNCAVCYNRSMKNLKAETAYIALVEQLAFDFAKRPLPLPPKRCPPPITISE